jgi:hypothetical protein
MVMDLCLIFCILLSGCIHMHMNCKLEYIRLIFMCRLIYQTMVEGILILRRGLINGCLIWLLKFSLMKVVDLLWS